MSHATAPTPAPAGAPPSSAEGHGEVIAKPIDHHPDGTPMTQEEIDQHWLKHVYRPNEPQLTPRAVITGMLIGGVMSLSNLYVGLKTGWGLAVTVTAAVLAFGVFSSLRRVAPVGPFKRDFGSLENNTMASAASAAGYFTGAGLTSAIPALFMATGKTFAGWELAIWILAISFLGVLLAVPMRRQMIDIDRLPFPEGMAYAETIRSLHAAPGEARKKAKALLYGALAGAGVKLLSGVTGFAGKAKTWALEKPILPEHVGPERWAALTLGLQSDILMIGAGAMMGVRISVGLLLGGIIGWGALAVWLDSHGLAGPGATFGTVRTWIVWPGVTLIVVNGLLAFALKWRTALSALTGLGRMAKGGAGGMSDVEVPAKWFLGGLGVVVPITVVLAYALFDIPLWMGLLATVLSILLSIVASRATGETSITPIGALGKITQFMYGGLAAGNIQTNLMTASITAGAAMHSADLLTDLKGGYVLGSRPRYQFLSQFFGILAGAVFCIPAYLLLATPERLGSADFPAPAAKTWQAVAELLAGGVEVKSRGETTGAAARTGSVPLGLVPVGTAAGDKLQLAEGPNAGDYAIVAVVDKNLVLDRELRSPAALEGAAVKIFDPAGAERGTGKAKKHAELPSIALASLPEGTVKGDWIKYDAAGHDVWWFVKGVTGTTAIVDRPFVDPRGDKPAIADGAKLEVRKESLPPHALTAVIVAALVAVVFTLLEVYAPKSVKRFVPSITGVGLGFVVAGFDSISMFIGALIAWVFEKSSPKKAEDYTLAGASGIMAGASLAGILIIVLSQVLGVLVTP